MEMQQRECVVGVIEKEWLSNVPLFFVTPVKDDDEAGTKLSRMLANITTAVMLVVVGGGKGRHTQRITNKQDCKKYIKVKKNYTEYI